MLVLVTYDVNTESDGGKKRLRRVAKCCLRYGQRVQNSVFECVVDAAQYAMMENELLKIIDQKSDSLRFYNLGNNYQSKAKHYGAKPTFDLSGTLLV